MGESNYGVTALVAASTSKLRSWARFDAAMDNADTIMEVKAALARETPKSGRYEDDNEEVD